jgi:hypothetical protein
MIKSIYILNQQNNSLDETVKKDTYDYLSLRRSNQCLTGLLLGT